MYVCADDIYTYLRVCNFNDARLPMCVMYNGNSTSAWKLFKFVNTRVCTQIYEHYRTLIIMYYINLDNIVLIILTRVQILISLQKFKYIFLYQ